MGNLGNRTLFVTVWQMIFSILQYKQYSVFFHSPELKWNLHHASRHSAAFSVIPLFYWPSVIFMQQHYSVHSSESHTFTIFYSFIQIPDCKLSTATPYLHHLFFFSLPFLLSHPSPGACWSSRSYPELGVPRPGPVCFHSSPGGQVIWGREQESRWPLAPDLFSLNLTACSHAHWMWESG